MFSVGHIQSELCMCSDINTKNWGFQTSDVYIYAANVLFYHIWDDLVTREATELIKINIINS